MKAGFVPLALAALVLVHVLAACSLVPATSSSGQPRSGDSATAGVAGASDPVCTELVTPTRVGNGLYKQFEIADKLKEGRFQKYESGGYVLCHYADPETSARDPILDIRYLFDRATGDLVLTHVEWRDIASYQETGEPVLQPKCQDYLTEARLGHAVFRHYRIAERLEQNDFVEMPSRDTFSCLTGREIDGAAVSEDELQFQFNPETKKLIFWRIHWRGDLPAVAPSIKISRADALAMVPGGVIHMDHPSFMSPDDSVPFHVSPSGRPGADDVYHHLCWFVWTANEAGSTSASCPTIIDAVTGELFPPDCPP